MRSAFCLFLFASAVAPVNAMTTDKAAATVNVLVTDRYGKPLPSAHVVVTGVSEREGRTNSAGRIVFTNVQAGSYILRVERDKFIAFEKDFAVSGQSRSTQVFAAISPVSSLAARPSKASASARPAVVPASPQSGQTPVNLVGENGTPQIVSVPDLVEKSLIGQRSVKESPIGCSGLTGARLIQVTEPLSDRHADTEEMLYVVAGEAALAIGEKRQLVKPGGFSIIPRGVPYALVRTGRNPVILLSVLGSQPCKSTNPPLYAEAQQAQTR
jgi:carboxypeptidase family protein/cupin domain